MFKTFPLLIIWYYEGGHSMKKCTICNKKLSGKQRMYCSSKCKSKAHNGSYTTQKKRGVRRKLMLLKEFGKQCSICGYNQNISALSFHHKNPKNKSFRLDSRNLSNRKQESILKEANKCILVCNNCHAEIHNPSLNYKALKLDYEDAKKW